MTIKKESNQTFKLWFNFSWLPSLLQWLFYNPSTSSNWNPMMFFEISSVFWKNKASKPTIEGKSPRSSYLADYERGWKENKLEFPWQNGSRVKLSAILIEKSSFFCWHYRKYEISSCFTWIGRSKSGKNPNRSLDQVFSRDSPSLNDLLKYFAKSFRFNLSSVCFSPTNI